MTTMHTLPAGQNNLYHVECLQRMLIGGVNHLLKRCSCCGHGTAPPDPPHLTTRQAALAAVQLFQQQHNLELSQCQRYFKDESP